ncbi:MAG TPA: D-alanyl-D-alanine carboxypeptidase [Thermoanaerobaculia bacterium]|nr:D-alanyl-D-alanine carboxypeptidase [Thermoanaerobaculia bacterium]
MSFLLAAILATSLSTSIDSIIAAPPFDHAVWGIEVENEAGNVLYAHDAHVLMIPASNRKLFSTATDVNCIGLDARLSTELWLEGDDVVLRGGGDPSFASERHESPGVAPFVAALRARGVRHVHDVIADVSLFSDRVTVPGSWKVGNLPADYSAPVDALAYDENVSAGEAVPDAALFAAQRLRDALVMGGISVDGAVKLNTAPRVWTTFVASVQSPTLFQLLTTVLKNSHNLYAEMLFKRSSPTGSYADSEELERRFAVDEAHVDPAEFRFVDGSGLAPDDLVTSAAIVKVLRWMNVPERRGTWWMILAQPGSEGTLHNRLKDLAGRMIGKTGSLNGVNALSGIVRGSDGTYRYFSIILNHHLASTHDALHALDAIAEEIAKF